jgi:hypothetical protein
MSTARDVWDDDIFGAESVGDGLPHAHGPAACDDCGHRWVAVWPLGAEALECPKCHSTNTDREQEKS